MKNTTKNIQFTLKWSLLLLMSSCQLVGPNQRAPTSSSAPSGNWLGDLPSPAESSVAKLVVDYEKKKKSALKKDAPVIAITADEMQPVAKYLNS